MLQSPEPKYSPNAAPANSYTPVKPATSPMDQANIGRSLVIKGEVTGAESLFIDGRVEGTISFPDNRVTIGRNGNVAANITAKEVVIMGKVQGNVDCADRLDIRSEGVLSGDVITHRISVEEGAILKGGVEVRNPEKKDQKTQAQNQNKQEATQGDGRDRGQRIIARSRIRSWNSRTTMERRALRADPAGRRRPALHRFLFCWMLLLRLEVERRRVHAVAQSGRPRAIRKHVAQMRIALGAARLGARHAITGVGVLRDVLAVGGGKEARPSGSRIKLCFRAKQQRATADAVVRSVVVFVPVLAGESALGAAGAGHLILLRSKLLPPLGVGLGDLVGEFVGHVDVSRNKMWKGRESCKTPWSLVWGRGLPVQGVARFHMIAKREQQLWIR